MSIGLTANELTSIRADIADLLPDTGYIIAVTNTPDGFGGYTQGTAVKANGTVSYRLDPKLLTQNDEKVAGGAIQPFFQWILTLQYNAPITTEDKFLCAEGKVYNVISVDEEKSWNASTRVIVEQT